ncbi:MAG: C4-dicarboxylate anaerobic carrier family protein [Firmicutes bacterium]|nr:C4-dicarboxylate anaerobic carrier family protein [Bacillota bacterium]
MESQRVVTNLKKDRLANIIDTFTEWSLNWIPDSMVFVVLLTLIVFCMSWGLTEHGPFQLIQDYTKGFWVLLTFAMQLCLLMITGFVVADSKPVKALIIKLVDWPKSVSSTIVMYCLVSGFVSWLHWGIGLMLGIVMGREIAVRKRGMGLQYPFLVGVIYSMGVLSNGPSQAAQLLVATPGHFLEAVTGVIPLTETTFNPHLLVTMLILYITIPIVMLLVKPKKEYSTEVADAIVAEFSKAQVTGDIKNLRPAEKLERSRILLPIIALGILVSVGNFIWSNGIGRLDLNTLNFAFFGLAMLLHASPHSFVLSVTKGVTTTSGIIIQFPLYAGIFGMIANSGLAQIITEWFISISTARTLPWIVFLYTGVIDFFVPSAGSKFVIEAPYIIPAAQKLGVSIPQILNAYTEGSCWVNMLQPFWALPVLGAMRIRFQDILPYTFITWLIVLIVVSFMFLVFPNGF